MQVDRQREIIDATLRMTSVLMFGLLEHENPAEGHRSNLMQLGQYFESFRRPVL